jgi:beta-glucanase (GH16 family)
MSFPRTIYHAARWLCAVALTPTTLLAGTLLNNPGFEVDPVGQTTNVVAWNIYGPNVYGETGAAHGGTNYLKVYQDFSGQVNYDGVYQDYISGPGTVYTASGWAFTLSSDQLGGQNIAWLEVSFRDANANVLALYRSALITPNTIAKGAFSVNTWNNLPVTNQYDPNTYVITNTVSQLVGPPGTYFVRYQIVFQGDAAYSGGSVYFDDCSLNSAGGTPYGSWNIVWSDEFNGTALNTNTWTYDLGNSGWGNSELENYTSLSNNSYVSNGYLNIVALEPTTNNFTSARIKSEGLFSWRYGRIEWRARVPRGTGCWPALWMLGTNITSISWPGCGEVDVMENAGSNLYTVQGSLHSGSDETASYNLVDGTTVTNFHLYTVDWSTNAFAFYVDGHLYEMQTGWGSSTTNAYPFPFNQPFFFIMNLAIGGQYLGYPTPAQINAGTVFPAVMQVDYVRIYQQTPPLQISISSSNAAVLLTWPSNIVCHLQAQTNVASSNGLGTNWSNVTTATNSLQVTPGAASAYYRLASP